MPKSSRRSQCSERKHSENKQRSSHNKRSACNKCREPRDECCCRGPRGRRGQTGPAGTAPATQLTYSAQGLVRSIQNPQTAAVTPIGFGNGAVVQPAAVVANVVVVNDGTATISWRAARNGRLRNLLIGVRFLSVTPASPDTILTASIFIANEPMPAPASPIYTETALQATVPLPALQIAVGSFFQARSDAGLFVDVLEGQYVMLAFYTNSNIGAFIPNTLMHAGVLFE